MEIKNFNLHCNRFIMVRRRKLSLSAPPSFSSPGIPPFILATTIALRRPASLLPPFSASLRHRRRHFLGFLRLLSTVALCCHFCRWAYDSNRLFALERTCERERERDKRGAGNEYKIESGAG